MPECVQLELWEPYDPQVNDYVIWDQGEYGIDEGWVYFKAPKFEPSKGFNTPARYITIETHVEDKPPELMECRTNNPHRKIHCLLLCYEPQWKQLKFVKRRESKHCCHYSQYDDVNVE